MRFITLALLAAGIASAQTQNPIVNSSKASFAEVKDYVLRSAEKVPENLWSFQPTPDVRTFGQLVAHIGDGQYEICGAVGTPTNKNIEKTAKGKAATIAAVKEAFGYCDAIYAKMTDATAGQVVTMFGQKSSRIGVMETNTAHTNLHYGNMITYMRIKGIVPASSEPRKP
ncbi:MAG TPA: DinB family protein [Bryobacteraceae bacterium]|jgi:hypothetical protein|nr:DinB family protein [Bryobacteraceae bacterium]